MFFPVVWPRVVDRWEEEEVNVLAVRRPTTITAPRMSMYSMPVWFLTEEEGIGGI